MKIVNPDDSNWEKKYKYGINAAHKWSLPGVTCSVCKNTWATVGVSYPCVNIIDASLSERLQKPQPVSEIELAELRKEVRSLFSNDVYLPPGTEFGPLEGKAWGSFGDFAWVNPWTILIQIEAYEILVAEGIQLPKGAKANLKFRSGTYPELIELQVEPLARLSPSSYLNHEQSKCSACGYDFGVLTRKILDLSSIPSDLDLFRMRDFPTLILASERFIEVTTEKDLMDIIFFKLDGAE